MRIKIGTEYLEFNDNIEIERQAKLFQDISGIFGDYSYTFDIPKTNENLRILDIRSINQVLQYDKRKNCELYSDTGELLYSGYLMVEGVGESIEASFFTGNSSWFEATRNNIRTYNFKKLEKEFNYANVSASWSLTNGVVWPLVDRGSFYIRDTTTLYDGDFQPFVYVKDIINYVLAQSGGIKIVGDLLNDKLYNSLITTNGGLSGISSRIEDQSSYIGKSSSQGITSSIALLTFTDIADPYYQSPEYSTATSSYTLKENMMAFKVDYKIILSSSNTLLSIALYLNGLPIITKTYSSVTSIQDSITVRNISAGDVLSVYAAASVSVNINTGSYVNYTPVKFRKVYPQQLLPDLDANEFISNVFTFFNVFSTYNTNTKTITTKFLDTIRTEPEIDISEYVSKVESKNFTELVADYGKSSKFLFVESGDDFVEEYNSVNRVYYGGGELVIDNDFLEDEQDFVEMDFTAPYQVNVKSIAFSLPLLEMNEQVIDNSTDYSNVQNSSGVARFRWPVATSGVNIFDVGDLVRVTQSTTSEYDGTHRVSASGTVGQNNYIELNGINYISNSTGSLDLIFISDIINEDQITIINVPNRPLSDFTEAESIYYDGNDITSIALGYFWLPYVNKNINRIRQALTFGPVNDIRWYQQDLLDAYYKTTENVLNDPVTINVTAYIPEKVYKDIDFLKPVRLKTDEFNLLFLVNKITGYVGSSMPCEMELIKTSRVEYLTIAETQALPAEPDPDPPVYFYYIAATYECGSCGSLGNKIISSLQALTIGKFYLAEYVSDDTLNAIVSPTATTTIDSPFYTVTDFTEGNTCGDISC